MEFASELEGRGGPVCPSLVVPIKVIGIRDVLGQVSPVVDLEMSTWVQVTYWDSASEGEVEGKDQERVDS
jgi:hypothetical protein